MDIDRGYVREATRCRCCGRSIGEDYVYCISCGRKRMKIWNDCIGSGMGQSDAQRVVDKAYPVKFC